MNAIRKVYGVIIFFIICSEFYAHSISGMMLYNHDDEQEQKPLCSGPTLCWATTNQMCKLVFKFRVDQAFKSSEMKWKFEIGEPTSGISSITNSQTDKVLFQDYYLCKVPGKEYSVLQEEKCSDTYDKSYPDYYKVVVPSIEMPKSPVTDQLYVSYGQETTRMIGLEVKDPTSPKPGQQG